SVSSTRRLIGAASHRIASASRASASTSSSVSAAGAKRISAPISPNSRRSGSMGANALSVIATIGAAMATSRVGRASANRAFRGLGNVEAIGRGPQRLQPGDELYQRRLLDLADRALESGASPLLDALDDRLTLG